MILLWCNIFYIFLRQFSIVLKNFQNIFSKTTNKIHFFEEFYKYKTLKINLINKA